MLKPLLQKLQNKRIVLASASKQREALLKSVNLNFEIYPSNFEENLDPSAYSIEEFVQKTALGKVNDVFDRSKNDANPPDVIIGADTVVAHAGRIYGKPKTKKDAFETIKTLTQSGLPNLVYTGVIVNYRGGIKTFTEVTKVFMAPLTDDEIDAYVESGEPMGKAGGYGIQGIANSFVQKIEGDYCNVVGLPLCRLTQVLKEIADQLN